MSILYGIFWITLLLAILCEVQKNGSHKRLYYSVAVCFLIMMCGIRDPFLYHDNDIYYEFFKGDYLANGEGTINFGYFFLNVVVSSITNNFQIFCFIVAIIVVWSYSNFIRSYSPYIGLSLLLFFFINYFPSYFILRQYLSMAFVFMSVKYVIERKQMKYLACVLLAISMHSMAICILPLYYLYGIKYDRKNIILLTIATIVACSVFIIVGRLLISIFPTYYLYVENNEGDPAWQRAGMAIFVLLLYIYCLGKDAFKVGVNRVVFCSILMCVIICVGGMNLPGTFRLKDFYSLAEFIGIPLIFYNARRIHGYKRYVIHCSALVYVIVLLIMFTRFVDGGNMNNEYQFFWEGTGKP